MEFSENAKMVLEKRYLKKGETIEGLFRRVAKAVAKVDNDAKYEKSYFDIMSSCKFLPNSPTLMNAGTPNQQLSACFVLPVEDDMEKIFETLKHTALIHKSGGGTGFSFSRLRPKGSEVKTTKGVSSGPVSFMSVFDAATDSIKQGGMRRGANMGVLRVDHPDIMDFIYAKENKTKLTNFNLSVGVTDKFMKSVKADRDFDLLTPRTEEKVCSINARKVFDEMVRLAWEGGDPGIIFLDRINNVNPTPCEGEIESTNPCGEQPLLPYESCNLGSINLAKFVKNNSVDWDSLEDTVKIAVRFLDNIIEINNYPIPQIEAMTKKNRKIGLGVMGWADMLVMLGIAYDSEDAISLAEKIMKFIRDKGREMSAKLAEERGSFPNFDKCLYPGFRDMRNATITTIAPTGTISIIAGASSGIEPYFALAYYRNVMDNNKLPEVNPFFIERAKKEGFYSESLMNILADKGNAHGVSQVPEKWRKVFVTSHEIKPIWHVRMQAAFQKYTDNAVSKTINFEKQATIKDIEDAYMLAYDLGCKGITVYRDGSRQGQVLNIGKAENKQEQVELVKAEPKERPVVLTGKTITVQTGCGKMYVTINQNEENKLFEVFVNIGKAGGCATSQCEAIGRLVSLSLKSGIKPEKLIAQLKGISCHMKYGFREKQVLSCSDAIGKALEKVLSKTRTDTINNNLNLQIHSGACPECGANLQYVEGCIVCRSCGYSRCS